MEICKELISLNNTVVGLGFFDGVHIAHRELISELVQTAKSNDLNSVLVTFRKSPAEKFVNDVEYLTTNEEKEEQINQLGVDYLFELEFDETLMNMSAKDYIGLLVEYFQPKYIFTGFNHTFGKGKTGTPELLAEFAGTYGYNYVQIPPVEYKQETISSTRIRKALKLGDVQSAQELLGRHFSIEGVVCQGQQIGRTIGFPTANVVYPERKVRIPFGVYSVSVEIEGEVFKGILNYGIKPTFTSDKTPLMEVHIFDFNQNVYNKPIKINLLKWIREERKFDSPEELKSQIEKDLKECLK